MYDAGVGRFTGVDPIGEQFAFVNNYNYAENSPIVNIDMWGLQAYSIHGLNSAGTDWDTPEFKRVQNTLLSYTNNENSWGSEFSWKANPVPRIATRFGSKGFRQRARAAKDLLSFIESTYNSGEEITLIGVSDGGNVAIQTAGLLHEKYGIQVNVITLNTPGAFGYNHPENPNNQPGINDLIEISTHGDFVVSKLGGAGQNPGMKENWEELMINSLEQDPNSPQIHATQNVDVEQIKNSHLSKLEKVPSRDRLTDEKKLAND